MKKSKKIFLILTLLFVPLYGSFAATGEKVKPTIIATGSEKEKKVEKETSTEDKEAENEVKKEINAYIIEAYKIQGNKILKDIDTSLQKMNLDDTAIVEAYTRIKETLEARKKRVKSAEDISENNKEIIGEYLNYMIGSLGKRIKSIE